MKCVLVLAMLAVASAQTAVSKVVGLMTGLRDKIDAEGKLEQQLYDKYACWCEKTLARKAVDISTAKDTIDELQTLINKLKGEIGTHTAEIAQLKKDIEANSQAQTEATELRNKENAEYESDRTQNEQCVGALEAAIKVLTGAGEGKKFLETYHEAQLLSVVAGVKSVLNRASAQDMISDDELSIVKKFVESPEEFV